jgi:phosphotransferase system enzyme I (PtsI)
MPVARGIAIAPACIIQRDDAFAKTHINPHEAAQELQCYEKAYKLACKTLKQFRSRADESLSPDEAAIFDVHIKLLEEREYKDNVPALIREQQMSAQAAVQAVTESIVCLFNGVEDEYMLARLNDFRELAQLLTDSLQKVAGKPRITQCLQYDGILVVDELMAGDILQSNTALIRGIISRHGNETAHATIIAKSLSIPMIIHVGDSIDMVANGDMLILDANKGVFVVNPPPEQMNIYAMQLDKQEQCKRELLALRDKKSVTRDGTHIELHGNAGNLAEVQLIRKSGGEGIGLFRTEFLFMENKSAPGEEEQFQIYRAAVQALDGHCLTIRTLDVGGDKTINYLGIKEEPNPFLGLRGIRYCFENLPLFEAQLRAIVRAAAFGRIRVMFPMVTTLEEVRQAKAILERVVAQLPPLPTEHLQVGIMVETPAAALMIDALMPEVDFVSIGTNDLCQYVLAADRTSALVKAYFDPGTPALLQLVHKVIHCGKSSGKHVSVCGEIASDIRYTRLLIGMGLKIFSVGAQSLSPLKEIILDCDMNACCMLAEKALRCVTKEALRAILSE